MIYAVPPIENPVLPGLKGKTAEDTPIIFGQIIASIVGILLVAGTIWTLYQLLLGGLAWISAGGDKGSLEAARNRITNALIGLLIMFAAWALYLLILQFLGIAPAGAKSVLFKLPTIF